MRFLWTIFSSSLIPAWSSLLRLPIITIILEFVGYVGVLITVRVRGAAIGSKPIYAAHAVKNRIPNNQLSFEFYERSAAAGVSCQYTEPLPYLLSLIRRSEPLIHLIGENPHICRVSSFSAFEPEQAIDAWVNRNDAYRHLKPSYYLHGYLLFDGRKAEIWRKK